MDSGEFARLKCWLNRKWETAEDWLPWFLGLASGLVLIVGVVAGLMRRDGRTPAGFVEISDSEVPASEIYADDSTENLNGKAAQKKTALTLVERQNRERDLPRDERRETAARGLVATLKEGVSEDEILERTGIPSVRSRAVVISTRELERKTGVEIRLQIELFSGLSPIFQMKSQSAFAVNNGMLSGTANDDPNSRAEISYENGMVSGFIFYRKKSYRIVADPARGIHYIVELKSEN